MSGSFGNPATVSITAEFDDKEFTPPPCWNILSDYAEFEYTIEDNKLRLGFDDIFLTFKRDKDKKASIKK